jgi:phosphoserine phosphatase SerB
MTTIGTGGSTWAVHLRDAAAGVSHLPTLLAQTHEGRPTPSAREQLPSRLRDVPSTDCVLMVTAGRSKPSAGDWKAKLLVPTLHGDAGRRPGDGFAQMDVQLWVRDPGGTEHPLVPGAADIQLVLNARPGQTALGDVLASLPHLAPTPPPMPSGRPDPCGVEGQIRFRHGPHVPITGMASWFDPATLSRPRKADAGLPLIERSPGLFYRQGLQLPIRLADYRLFGSDMDATAIAEETMIEIAKLIMRRDPEQAGLLRQMDEQTQAAMRGDIPFEAGFCNRAMLLAGTPVALLDEVFHDVTVTPGYQRLLEKVSLAGMEKILTSGGPTQIVERVAALLGFDHCRGTQLEESIRRCLTGLIVPQYWGSISGPDAKVDALEERCIALGIDPSQVIYFGDGANDEAASDFAGLSVGYMPKPALAASADVVITEGGIDRFLELCVAA